MDPVLCNAILTLTARFIPQLIEYHRGAQEASEYYANLIRSTLLLEADNPTLERVQALLMLSLHEWGSLRGGRAWIYVGLALQMGFLLRIIRRQGRKNLDDRIPGTPEEFLQSECRIRSFWACSMMADFISSGCDRVRLVHEERVSIPLPVSEERFLWCLVDDQTRMSAEDSEKGHLIKIVELWSEISRWVCGHKREEEQSPPWSEDSTFFRLRQALSDWAVALPPKHRYNASMFNAHAIAGYAASYGFMHLVYCTAVIFLHREYIQVLPDRSKPYWDRDGEKWGPPPDAAFWKKSLLDLFGASKRATDILNKLWSLGASVLTPFVGFSAFTASGMNIYLAILPWMCPELSVDARTYAEQTVNYLKNIMKIWPIAEKWYKSVLKLYNTYRLYVTEGVAPASPEGDVLDTFEHLDSSFLNYGEFAICPNDSGLSKGPQPTNGLLANSTDATGPVLQVSASRNETDLGEFADESLDPTHDSLEAILSQIFRDEFGDGTDIASFWPS
ncbi:hypothetical protein AOQ84DRAFT_330475 [Glonium stellatum]|uniref:Xylanolytic transcriptional activator regulatory domain-containing protein n=1 Tax=Glonium stellatum TaxID=574774 RepID=A0A8E2FE70_9PEZI|nr:hypothetical protein AOQ84DRAFT_330475 [Glonium stellatum]